jgi:membrane-bound hydrogenase subunit beta
MNDQEIIEKIKDGLKDKALDIFNPAPRRIFFRVDKADLRESARFLKEALGCAYLATISGVDKGENFEIVYHFANQSACISLRTLTPRASPHIPSICPEIPGAILYERELQDMFGLVVDGIPDSRPLVLPDDWPADNYPLRKDWKFERPPENIPGGK